MFKNHGGKMELTIEQAITEHRKMWNWIADKIIRLKKLIDVYSYKKEYLYRKRLFDIDRYCFLCDYCRQNRKRFEVCEKCPLDWGDVSNRNFYPCEGDAYSQDERDYGLWWKCQKAKTWEEQARIAREIANLPEKKYGKNLYI